MPHFYGSADADILNGGGGVDFLHGLDGDDTLNGGGGDDMLIGGAGADAIDGGAGTFDAVRYLTAVSLNLTTGVHTGEALGDTFANIERFVLSDFADTVVGTNGDDRLYGEGGNDILNGGLGVDNLFGGDGQDQLNGGDGNDYLTGGLGGDIIDGGAGTFDTVQFTAATELVLDPEYAWLSDGEALGDTYVNVERFLFGEFNDRAEGTDANERFDGGGGDDYLFGVGGADTLFGGAGSDIIYAGAGNDVADGGDGGDYIQGDDGDDILTGGASDDGLEGGSGDDLMIGGEGGDYLTGGQGTDTASYATAAAGITLIYTNDVEPLWTGTGEAAGDVFNSVEGFVLSSFNDTFDSTAYVLGSQVRGGAGDDTISGSNDSVSGQDILWGDAGNDILNGWDAADILHGGLGADTLRGGGNNDTMNGGAGDDTLIGGAGADINDGGDGFDTVSFVVSASFNLLTGARGSEAAGDTFINVERFVGGTGADNFTGAGGADWFEGSGGNDVLTGGDGNDILKGGVANDILTGGEGDDLLMGGLNNDQLIGGNGVDTASYAETTAAVSISRTIGSASWTGEALGDSFNSIERFVLTGFNDTYNHGAALAQAAYVNGGAGIDTLTGGTLADELFGGDGNDVLSGGDGNDYLTGGAGADSMDGGTGAFDTALYATAVTLNLSTGVHTGEALGDTFANVERYSMSSGADTVTGSAVGEQINGNGGNDVLNGMAGVDTVFGNDGDDVLNGGDDNDYLSGGAGADAIDGGAGTYDTVQFSAAVSINLATGVHTGEALGDSYVNVERFLLSAFNDSITGTGAVENFEGGAGADTLDGAGGNDQLTGGLGDDVMTGGTGLDIFILRGTGTGADNITDFANGADRIRFAGVAGVDDLSDLVLSTNGSGWAVITLPDGSSITLNGMTEAQVDTSDFLWI